MQQQHKEFLKSLGTELATTAFTAFLQAAVAEIHNALSQGDVDPHTKALVMDATAHIASNATKFGEQAGGVPVEVGTEIPTPKPKPATVRRRTNASTTDVK